MQEILHTITIVTFLCAGLGIAVICISAIVYPAYIVVYNIIELCRSLKEGQQ